MILIALIAALTLAGVSAFFSVYGLAQIFHGAFISVVVMGTALEIAKLSTAVLVHRYWDSLTKAMRGYLVASTVVLMVLTSAGIFGYLSKASQTLATGIAQTQTEISYIDKSLESIQEQRQRQENVIARLDGMVDKYTSQESFADVRRGARLYANQEATRKSAQQQIAQLDTQESELVAKKLKLQQQTTAVEVEVGPAVYIAQALYGGKDIGSIEAAIRVVILMIIFAFDPLAICLLLAVQQVWGRRDTSKDPVTFDIVVEPPVLPVEESVVEEVPVEVSEEENKKPLPMRTRRFNNRNSM